MRPAISAVLSASLSAIPGFLVLASLALPARLGGEEPPLRIREVHVPYREFRERHTRQ